MNLFGIFSFPVQLLRAIEQLTEEVHALRAVVEAAPAPVLPPGSRRTTKPTLVPEAPQLDLMLPL